MILILVDAQILQIWTPPDSPHVWRVLICFAHFARRHMADI